MHRSVLLVVHLRSVRFEVSIQELSLEEEQLAIVVSERTIVNSERVERTKYLLEKYGLMHRVSKLVVELKSFDVEEVIRESELIFG